MRELLDGFQSAIPFEEMLLWTENAAYTISLDAFATAGGQIVGPELVLDEYGNLWMCQS